MLVDPGVKSVGKSASHRMDPSYGIECFLKKNLVESDFLLIPIHTLMRFLHWHFRGRYVKGNMNQRLVLDPILSFLRTCELVY